MISFLIYHWPTHKSQKTTCNVFIALPPNQANVPLHICSYSIQCFAKIWYPRQAEVDQASTVSQCIYIYIYIKYSIKFVPYDWKSCFLNHTWCMQHFNCSYDAIPLKRVWIVPWGSSLEWYGKTLANLSISRSNIKISSEIYPRRHQVYWSRNWVEAK